MLVNRTRRDHAILASVGKIVPKDAAFGEKWMKALEVVSSAVHFPRIGAQFLSQAGTARIFVWAVKKTDGYRPAEDLRKHWRRFLSLKPTAGQFRELADFILPRAVGEEDPARSVDNLLAFDESGNESFVRQLILHASDGALDVAANMKSGEESPLKKLLVEERERRAGSLSHARSTGVCDVILETGG